MRRRGSGCSGRRRRGRSRPSARAARWLRRPAGGVAEAVAVGLVGGRRCGCGCRCRRWCGGGAAGGGRGPGRLERLRGRGGRGRFGGGRYGGLRELSRDGAAGLGAGDHADGEDGEDEHHQELADEQTPEEAPARQGRRVGVRPGGGDVVGLRYQGADGPRGPGEGDRVGPGALRQDGREAGGRPDEDGEAEEEGQEADQQAVGDAAARGGSVRLASCMVRPPWSRNRGRRGGVRWTGPFPPPPVRRRACRPGGGSARRTRSWRGR